MSRMDGIPCASFFGIECPEEPFPSANDTGDFKTILRQLDWMRVQEVTLPYALILAAAGVAVAAAGVVAGASDLGLGGRGGEGGLDEEEGGEGEVLW